MPSTPWPAVVRVAGRSMQPTLEPGDLLLTLPVAGRRGDLVVLRHESGARYVKRVVAAAGDVVELEAGRLRVNGRAMDGRPPGAGAVVARWEVPPGTVFVVGDNQLVSDDSRTWTEPFVPVGATRRAVRLPTGCMARAGLRPVGDA
ncbi:signal peptidase I [Aestuariimicrobium sp. T2.26MG-19.2B]|uniref:signal peptidase I n=1 Tax=Aestuariimicrobium sp. T2.26MG-19.2B TaxID=3040679 RepID=UPI00254033AD|nr:signal peptidase I [Aestuariimicrobium sp. T2.26MG-19.2B]